MTDDLKTPERIWACLSVNSKNGTVVLLGHAHFDLSGWQEYVRADLISEVVKERDEYHGEAMTYIEKWGAARKAQDEAEAKLTKAVEALRVSLEGLNWARAYLSTSRIDSVQVNYADAMVYAALAEMEGKDHG